MWGVDSRDRGPNRGLSETRQESRALCKDFGDLDLFFVSFATGMAPRPLPTTSPKEMVDPSVKDEKQNENIILLKRIPSFSPKFPVLGQL